jgi:4-amino-4-deoxy-L-arabinose transferase-like glycosyltransferase
VDEMSVIRYSQGILKTGYPRVQLGSFNKRMTTYELVAYPLAASMVLFGESESALRIPAALFGTLTIALIGLAGWRSFDWRVGLSAALICALHPACRYWSGNAFWPSQGQFFELVAVWCFFEATRTRPFRTGFLTAATCAFICSYLSWEGTGFLLPSLFVAMLCITVGNYEWLKNWHLWRCLFVMTVVILLQLFHRQISSIPTYLQTGTSLSEVSTPGIIYLDSTKFNPWYYFNYFLFTNSNYVASLVVLLGMPFCWRDLRCRFYFAVLLMLVACYSALLPAYSVRYSHHYQTFLIILAVAIAVKLIDRVIEIASLLRGTFWQRWLGAGAGAAALALLVLASNESVLHPYRFSEGGDRALHPRRSGGIPNRVGVYRTDYQGAARFVKAHLRPGDGLVVAIPHAFSIATSSQPIR